jgi:hypothetical protein
VKLLLFGENFFGGGLVRLRGGERSFALGKLFARLVQFRFALRELLAQFIFQPRIGGRDGLPCASRAASR